MLLFTTDEGGVIEAVLVTVACADAAEEKSIRNSQPNVLLGSRRQHRQLQRLPPFRGLLRIKRFPNYPFIRPSYTPLHGS